MSRELVELLVVLVLLTGACAPRERSRPAADELTVFAAASLTEPFRIIGEDFGRANGVKVTFNFGGSQQLAQQLAQGAPADVFASANRAQMEIAVEAGRVEGGGAHTFARNRLIVVAPVDNPGRVAKLADLARPGLKIVLAAREVPVGQYSIEMLERAEAAGVAGAGFRDEVLRNVVSYEENVRAVLAKVALGEVDAGVVYTSDVPRDGPSEVSRIDVPDAANVVAVYPIAVVKDGPRADLGARFVDYVRSPAGQTVLVKHGFVSTTGDATGAAPGAVPVEVTGRVASAAKFGAADLAQFEQAEAPDGTGVMRGARISALLDAARILPGATKVALVGGDGYRRELTIDEARADTAAIVTATANGSLLSIVPSKGPGFRVKGLVRIEVF